MWRTTTSIGPTEHSARHHRREPSHHPLQQPMCGFYGSIVSVGCATYTYRSPEVDEFSAPTRPANQVGWLQLAVAVVFTGRPASPRCYGCGRVCLLLAAP